VFNRLGVRDKILTMLVVPLLAVLGLGGVIMTERWQAWGDMEVLGELATVSPVIGKMVHEMQIERGLSAGFIGSKGAPAFQGRLDDQREAVDLAEGDLRAVLDRLEEDFPTTFAESVDLAREQIADLSNKRRAVSRQELTVGQMAGYYTGTIGNLLALIERANTLTDDGTSGRAMTAYVAFLQAKERAGLERAMGANGFGKGAFQPNIHRRFVSLIGQQNAYLDTFRSHATTEEIVFYDDRVSGPVSDEVDRMRKIAIASLSGGGLGGITGPQWFDAITKKIDRLHDVELTLADNLVAHAATEQVAASWAFMLSGAFIIGAFALTIGFGLFNCFLLVRPIRSIRSCVIELAAGRDIPIPGTNRGDEIGDLARSLEEVYQRGLEAARLRTALDSSQTLVLVANRRLEIVYTNPALLATFRVHEAAMKAELPNFDVDGLIGTKVETLHSDPSHYRRVIEGLTATHQDEMTFGDIRFELSINPIIRDGDFLGVIVEWRDKSNEDDAMTQIEAVMTAANKGDFSGRIDAEGMTGVLGSFGNGINQLATLVDSAITDVGGMLGAVAEGDLTRRLSGDYEGALGDLQESANQTAERLSTIVADIQSVAESVRTAASEIDSGTEDLSNRTEKAASNLEETAAATEQMSATVNRNAESAGTANDLAGTANQAAAQGGDVVQQVVTAMSDIKASTNQMTDIISVIDEIAFQTNLLALNASVEAARAGEAGKGFAVVAQEVRALAQRSATAASDIKGLIKDSNQQVQSGVDLVNQAGDALTDIVGSIGKVADIIREIASASKEQAIGIQEISSSVNQMDEMTQQNSALVEESAAAANTLSDQSSQLGDLMRFFKLSADKVVTPALVPTAPQPVITSKPSTHRQPSTASADVDGDWEDF